MDASEIRMRCLEVACAASRSAVPTQPEVIVGWASKFEAYVNGEATKAPPAPRAKKEAAQ